MRKPTHTRRPAATALTLLALAVIALAVAGCGGSKKSGSAATPSKAISEVAAGTLKAGDTVPVPAPADVALTITGGTAKDTGGTLALSIAQLESMRTVEATVYEPFLKRNVTFRGVPLQDLLDLAGVPDGFSKIDSVAYNEYAVTLPATILRHQGVVLATRADGKLIPLDKGGPSRIVFTDDHPDTKNESLWIWSTKTMALR